MCANKLFKYYYDILFIGVSMKENLRNCDKPLLVMTIIFSILGLLMVFSASSIISSFSVKTSPYHYFVRQLIFISLCYGAFFIFILHFPIAKYKNLTIIYGLVMLASLILLFPFGVRIYGAKSWFNMWNLFHYQPSEFTKIFIILYLAFFFERYQKIKNIKKSFYYPLIIIMFILFLILRQPDLGTAVLISVLTFGIYFFIPLNKKNKKNLYFMITLLVILGGLSFLVFKNDFLKGFQKERFNYKQPCLRYVERSGYQLCNSFIAINNGGLFGSGLGNSTQKYLYLPAGHTDFIFAIILEELGSIVGVLIIIAYIYMLYRIVKIAKSTSNLRNSIIAFGTFIIISVHILINLAGILGLIPLTGIPLPFLSYGGSFTIVTYMLIFLVQRVAVENNQSKLAKELKRL